MTGDAGRVIQALRPLLGERLLTPDEPGYAAARRVWNAAVPHRPAAIARCSGTEDVQAVIRSARDAGVPLSVRSGGHDWGGRALRDRGLVVDLTGMRGVRVDARHRTATVQGGAIIADLLAAAAPHGLVTPTGVVRAVGLTGLTTSGGYGPLIGRYGLTADNLLGAQVVLADGTTTTAGPDGDAELWWALRGGGGNFGVVTELTYRLHELPTVLAGMLMFPFADAGAVLTGYAAIVAEAPDELTVMTGFLPGPDGPLAFLCPLWSGDDLAAGEKAVARLRSLGRPVVDQIAEMPYAAALSMFDASMTDGNHYLLRSRWIPALSDVAVAALTAGAATLTSPYSGLIVTRLHGAATRVEPGATAFAHRTPHQVIEVIAAFAPDEPVDRHWAWADSVTAALDPVALPGAYPNLLGPGDDERARASFAGNLGRLRQAKRRYDPDNVFASAIPALAG